MSITGAAGGDVTQFDHFSFATTPTEDLQQDLIVLEAQEARDIILITLSGRLFGFDSMDANETMLVEGTIEVSLGQEAPRAGINEYRAATRMPIVHNYVFLISSDSNGDTNEYDVSGFDAKTYLGDPDIRFLWQQGETLFIRHSVTDQHDNHQRTGVRFDGVVGYVPA